MKKAGAIRISDEAVEELAKVVEEELLEIAREANALARHAGRKTIFEEDVKLAKKKVLR